VSLNKELEGFTRRNSEEGRQEGLSEIRRMIAEEEESVRGNLKGVVQAMMKDQKEPLIVHINSSADQSSLEREIKALKLQVNSLESEVKSREEDILSLK